MQQTKFYTAFTEISEKKRIKQWIRKNKKGWPHNATSPFC